MPRFRRQRRDPTPPPRTPDIHITHEGERRTRSARTAPPDVDARIAELAAAADGLVTREQLLALPLSSGAIDGRRRARRLHVVFRGVYAVGHAAPSARQRLRAALLVAGAGAALSHRTGCRLLELIEHWPDGVDVLVAGRGPRSRPGLRVHETRVPFDVVVVAGLPVTAPLRCLHDLARVATAAEVERACTQALVRGLVTQAELDAAGLVEPGAIAPTPSAFARVLHRALRQAGLPAPVVEHPIGRFTADFAWTAERVIVETDGFGAHGHRAAFEHDRARDAYLAARGWVVVRVTWRRLRAEPMRVMAELAAVLARRAAA